MNSPTLPSRISAPTRILLLMFLLCPAGGCSIPGKLAAWKHDEPASEVLISYTVKNAVRDLDPWSSFADRGLESASWTTEDKPDRATPRSAALEIRYPHPERGDEFALATLSVYDRPLNEERFSGERNKRWYHRFLLSNYFSRGKDDETPAPSEIVTLQIPRTQFELLFNETNQARYLEENHTSKGSLSTALLSISKNRKAIHESSVEDPRLNEVIQHVYRNGEVILGQKRQAAPSILQTSAFIEAPNPTVLN